MKPTEEDCDFIITGQGKEILVSKLNELIATCEKIGSRVVIKDFITVNDVGTHTFDGSNMTVEMREEIENFIKEKLNP